jgi:uncharacterized protein (DUF1501 family)
MRKETDTSRDGALLLARRRLLLGAGGGLLGALLARLAPPGEALAAEPPPKAKACVVLWMNGGMSHIDTFDPKPGAKTGGSFKAIKTKAKGVLYSEHAPLLAEQAHKIAVVRGMTSKEGNHDRARYLLHTGYAPTPTAQHPSLGAWVSQGMGDKSADLPSFISISGPSVGAGALGIEHGPLVLQKAGEPPQNVDLLPHVHDARFDRRRAALAALEARFAKETGDPKVTGRGAVYDKAIRLMRSQHRSLFEVAGEAEAVKKAYGDSDFGRGCLIARRLVEAGVKFVEVTLDGWDTHKDNFERVKKQLGKVDPAVSALIRELDERKLLGSTLVVLMSEFGRTPKINDNDGRDHYPQAWTALLAGGGIRGGIAHGGTDAEGAKVVEKPVTVPDLFATLATQLGQDPAKTALSGSGRPISLTDSGTPVAELIAQG